jgi:hypothetical protein
MLNIIFIMLNIIFIMLNIIFIMSIYIYASIMVTTAKFDWT